MFLSMGRFVVDDRGNLFEMEIAQQLLDLILYGAETSSGRQDVLVNHTTETIATLDTSLAAPVAGATARRVGQGGVRASAR
jgi:hypothetical protein